MSLREVSYARRRSGRVKQVAERRAAAWVTVHAARDMGGMENPLDWRSCHLDAAMNAIDPDAAAEATLNSDLNGSSPAVAARPRVLMTASTLPRWPGDVEPGFILQLAQALASEFDLTILAPHCPGARRLEKLEGVSVQRFRYAPAAWENLAYQGGMLHKLREKPLRWLLVPLFILGQMLAIRRLHRQRPFDILHAHWIVPQGLAAAVLKRTGLLNIPSLLTSHGGDLFSLGGMGSLKHWVLASMDRVSVVSNAMVPVCEELGLDRNKVLVRSMGVDLGQRFVPAAPSARRRGLVFVGRLVEKKGVDTLLAAFARVHRKYPGESLTIVGDGPLRSSLETLAQRNGCNAGVNFIGAVPNEDVPTWLKEAKIAVVPSVVSSDGDQEGLGLAAVEAMGCGCATVCSDLPALGDVVTDGVNGRVFPAGDVAALAAVLEELLDNPTRISALAEAGRRAVRERFDWRAVAADYGECYRKLMTL